MLSNFNFLCTDLIFSVLLMKSFSQKCLKWTLCFLYKNCLFRHKEKKGQICLYVLFFGYFVNFHAIQVSKLVINICDGKILLNMFKGVENATIIFLKTTLCVYDCLS